MPTRQHGPYLITNFLAIGPCRGAGGPSVDSLARAGFRHIIDLNADRSEKSLSRLAEVDYHPIETYDEHSVELWIRHIQEAVSIIEQAARHNQKVYLHCTYGFGRSPTIAMAYLVSKNRSIQEAIRHVKKRGRLIWNEGNPVQKYGRVLQAYEDSISGRPSRR